MTMPMHTNRRPAALAAALALMLASPAFGADPYRPSMDQGAASSRPDTMSKSQDMSQTDSFGKADSNRDGILNRNEYQTLQKSQAGASGMAPASSAMTHLVGKRAKDLKGAEVLNKAGTKIGKVEKVVQSRTDEQLYAVVSVGGFLGIGDTELTMPLHEMGWQEGKLVAPTTASKKQLKARPGYDEMAYREIDDEQGIARLDAMPGGPSSQTAQSFEALDANKDDRIDRSEFSAFESGEPSRPSTGGSSAPSGRDMKDKAY